MDNQYFGPRLPGRVLNKNDRLHKMWIDLNRTAESNPRLKAWIREGFDQGMQQADMAEEWERFRNQNPPPPTIDEQARRQANKAHDEFIERQKTKYQKPDET